MKKKLVLSVLIICLVSSLFGIQTVNGAVKEKTVSSSLITTTGVLNEVDWILSGEGADTVYVNNFKGDIFRAEDVGWGAGWLCPWDSCSFAKGDVTMEFDLLKYAGGSMRPYIGSSVTGLLDSIWVGASGIIDSGAHSGGPLEYYSDAGYQTAYEAISGANAWYYIFPGEYEAFGSRVKYVFKADGTLFISRAKINEDGTYGGFDNGIYIKNSFIVDNTTGYYFGINYWGNLEMDNFKVTAGDSSVISETNFSGQWDEREGVPTSGKILNFQGNSIKIAELILNNPGNNNRIVSDEKIVVDQNVNKVLKIASQIDFRTLSKKFGFAFGLSEQNQAVNAEGTSYLYFENIDNITYVNVAKNGVAGTAVSLGKDLTAEDFIDVEITGYKDGSIIITVEENEITFEGQNLAGHIAMITDGEGEAVVAIGAAMSVMNYSYRGSEGEAAGCNFNTDYINPANFVSSSNKAVMYENPDEAKGIEISDNTLFFNGTADNSYFSFSEKYADYILEFDYITFNEKDKPALKESWTHGHSALAVCLGSPDNSGWAKSIMILLRQDSNIVQMQNYKDGLSVVESGAALPEGTTFNPEEGKTITNKMKIISANNKISVYMITVSEAAYTAADYVLAAEFEVPDTFGYISFGTTEAGYFKIDNVQVTPIDNPDISVIEQNIKDFIDFKPISDEYRPFDLNAPQITLTGNVASWEAVEDASGYSIIINGETAKVGADVVSYTFTQTEAGEYVLTVIALGNDSYIRNSEQSNAVTYTVKAPEEKPASSCSGCNSNSAAASLMVILFAAISFFKFK